MRRLFSDSLFSFSLKLLAAVAALSLCGCASTAVAPAPPPGSIAVEGHVSLEGRGHGGVTVELYALDAFNAGKSEAAPAADAVTGESGSFTIYTMPGRYLLMARTSTPSPLFAFYGKNPVNASADQRGINMQLLPATSTLVKEVSTGDEMISGRILHNGEPVSEAVASLYLETDRGFRGPPYLSAPPAFAGGYFEMTVEPGRYFLVARLRKVSAMRGPMEPGDMYGVHPVMPIKVAGGTAITADIEVVELPDADKMARLMSRFAVIEGIALDLDGNPVAGLRPCLYEGEVLLNNPVEIGDATGEDGNFSLKTTRNGFFHLGARTVLGGPPASGEQVGYAATPPPGGFELKPGTKITGVHMIVRRAP